MPLNRNLAALSGSSLSEVDSGYAWWRLLLTLVVGTVACVGNWSVVVLLPALQLEFGTERGDASLPFTSTMIGFAFGGLAMGRLADRIGIVGPILVGALLLCIGYLAAALTTDIWQFSILSFVIGLGSAAGFAPLISDLSLWFRRYRALAVAFAASGSYLAGAVWPMIVEHFQVTQGWRSTHVGIGILLPLIMVPIALLLSRRPQNAAYAEADASTAAARSELGLKPNVLQTILVVAGFSCCMAMSMPQVHLVAYCGDLGYGVAVGTQIIALMLGLGVISRVASGAIADRIGALPMLIIGSSMQAFALMLYVFFNSKSSLYVISGLFGLFQGGIVPMYAVIIRQFLPPREAGMRISLVLTATVIGMACGGLAAGYIFDATGSYRLAFLHGFVWNCLNLALVSWLFLLPRLQRRRQEAIAN
ncbi:MAG: MFS transporter [Hyphomicrobiales bacterium]